jgi:hypothetical protein
MQITQTIAPDCGHLYVYHRWVGMPSLLSDDLSSSDVSDDIAAHSTPEWILPRDDAPWPESQKKEWRENPLEYAVYRGKYNR